MPKELNQSISEEWENLFEGHCICDKYAPQEDIGCIIHGEDGIKAKKFIQSKISQAIAAERKELIKTIDSFPLQDQMFFDDANWKAGYAALEELKKHLISLLEEK